jgi:RimJ/RimL family protein N-acetyltransferase
VTAPPEKLDAAGIGLRRWQQSDLDPLLEIIERSLDHLRPWMPWASAVDLRAGTAGYLTQAGTDWDTGTAFNYAITLDGRLVGSTGLMARIGPGGLEIGYWVDVAEVRKGIARRATAGLTETGLALPGVDHIEIHHDVANAASGAVPRSLGFREVGRVPVEATASGEAGEHVIWRLTAAELPASRVAAALGRS